MAQPLMPKATAVWLVDNTTLTFDQIATYCELHSLEVQAIADGEVAPGMHGLDPIANGQLTNEEIARCEEDASAQLEMAKPNVPLPKVRQKGARYTPISKRQDRPDAIAWLLRNYPELSDAQISRMIGTTKPTINAVRDKTHHNSPNIQPQSPVYLGLCTPDDLEKTVATARARSGTSRAAAPLPEEPTAVEAAAEPPENADNAATDLAKVTALFAGPTPAPAPDVSADTLFKERPGNSDSSDTVSDNVGPEDGGQTDEKGPR
ncbi:MAG: cell cycle transcriptional regulator TrcR [Pseudomonadota bacterium]|nr:cell cycle transcriptional regulator TrcR [Pseudomonadota bacterium]